MAQIYFAGWLGGWVLQQYEGTLGLSLAETKLFFLMNYILLEPEEPFLSFVQFGKRNERVVYIYCILPILPGLDIWSNKRV